MDRRGIKTLLIWLLLVTDIFLLGLFLARRWQDYRWEHDLQVRLEQRLEEYGLQIHGVTLPQTTLPVLEHIRSADAEAAAAQFLLGVCQAEDQGGGIELYTGHGGTARFRSLGEFEILPEPPLILTDPAADIALLARELGLLSEGDLGGLSAADSGYTVYQSFGGTRLADSEAVFTVSGEKLLGVSGRWLTGHAPTATGETGHTAAWALLMLAAELDGTGQRAGTLLAAEPVYRMSAVSARVTRLIPCWRITLDSGEYMVNALSGEATVR